jgi:hypothetical protein
MAQKRTNSLMASAPIAPMTAWISWKMRTINSGDRDAMMKEDWIVSLQSAGEVTKESCGGMVDVDATVGDGQRSIQNMVFKM